MIKNKDFQLANDPTKNLKIPAAKDEVPYLDFSALQNAMAALEKTVVHVNEMWNKSLASSVDHDVLNKILYQSEQQLLSDDGLPRRPWYKHTLYAPGFYTGYGVKTMPGIREAIEQRNWKEAQEQIAVAAAAIKKLSDYLNTVQ